MYLLINQKHNLHSWENIKLLHKVHMVGAPMHKTQPTLSNKSKIHNMSHYIIMSKIPSY